MLTDPYVDPTVSPTLQRCEDNKPEDTDKTISRPEILRYTRTLEAEYTTEHLKAQSVRNHPDYLKFWGQRILGSGNSLAQRDLSGDEIELRNEKFQYKFHVKGEDRPTAIAWLEAFVPEALTAPPKCVGRTWDVPQDQAEHDSPVLEIDPSIRGEDGTYLIAPVEFEIIHSEKVRDIDGNETAEVVNPGKDTLLRDEIAELRIKVPPLRAADWNLQLDLETPTTFTENLGTRANVKMYDFGRVEQNGTITPLTIEANGTTKFGPYDITLPAAAQGEATFKIVVNKAAKFKLRLKTANNTMAVMSQEFTVAKRIRKYATKEQLAQQESNDFDTFFEDSVNWWADWEVGDPSGNYTFKDNGARYTPELLKAIAWKECDLHPANAAAHGTTQYDIMQVNAGNRPGSADMSGSGALADWNNRAPTVAVEVLIGGSYQVKQLYLFESDPPQGVQANDFSVRKMRYPATGLQTIGNYRDSVRWSLRKLLYKQYNLEDTSNDAAGQANFRVTYRVKGAGDTLFAVKPPALRALDETIRRYGDGTQQYPVHVNRMKDEGIGTRGTGDEYRWPRLTNDKARH
jgi:hypothetical protein